VPKIRITRTVSDPPERVWDTLSDPYNLVRWWPRVSRVEGVSDKGFTEVLQTPKGRGIRADFTWVGWKEGETLTWEQDLAGTPFERVFARSQTTVELASAGTGTAITIVVEQDLRGWARFSPWMVRSATKRVATEAADGLVALHDGG
jgi:uncharacterized protein YndB with AHSA1/START domain